MSALLVLDGVTKRFRGLVAVDEVSFEVEAGEICGVIGPNGAGKTTLFNMIAGVYTPDGGTITFAGAAHRRALGRQASAGAASGGRFSSSALSPASPSRTTSSSAALLHRPSVADAREKALDLLRRLDLYDKRHQKAASLTLPDRKRLEVTRALATEPKLLLLDEVMAGLRPTETDRMVATLKALNQDTGLTIVLIEHVMRAVMALASHIVVLHHGALIADGPPETVVRDAAVIESYLGAEAPA